jgi:hypothetical protein
MLGMMPIPVGWLPGEADQPVVAEPFRLICSDAIAVGASRVGLVRVREIDADLLVGAGGAIDHRHVRIG